MKKNCLLAIMAVVTLASCVHERLVFTKEEQSQRNIAVKAFESIEVKGSPTVLFSQAENVSVNVSGPKSQVDIIDVRQSGGRLIISKQKNLKLSLADIDEVTVTVTGPDLVGVSLLGSGDFRCVSSLDTDTLRLALHGSGDVDFPKPIVCDRLDAEVLGSGDLKVKRAKTSLANLSLTGSGDLKVGLKDTQRTRVSLVGSGDADVDFDNCQHAECMVKGSGDIELSGQIEHLSEQKSGSGSIDKEKLTLKK